MSKDTYKNPCLLFLINTFHVTVVVVCCLCNNGYSQEKKEGVDEKPVEEKPLWEIGLFNGAIYLPDYRGAEESRIFAIPLPYMIYRGKKIQTEADRVNSIFFRSDRWEMTISLFGNPPVDDDNDAREGMPDLDPIVEIGPVLKWYFWGRDPRRTLYLSTAVRSAISAGFDELDFAAQGYRGVLSLIYKKHHLFGDDTWSFGVKSGIDFTDQTYNGYFYDVPSQFATVDREFFDSDSGYAGFMLSSSVVKKITKRVSLGVFFRWDNVNGAVYENSPLARRKNNITIGSALIWKLAQSKRPGTVFR